ncbi:MAG: hypothetical protein E7112_06365 [Bacteroidales bacterium]|nr:hypothetical protein [Bacteroidales bacterium]
MKKILLVEDNGIITRELEDALANYHIEKAYSVCSALDRWILDGPFECIIVDLQISPEGLSPEENGFYTPLFGMAFINKIKDLTNKEEEDNLKKRIIIYSGYVKELKQHSLYNEHKLWQTKDLTICEKDTTSISKVVNMALNILK